jgi:hypothetical protein
MPLVSFATAHHILAALRLACYPNVAVDAYHTDCPHTQALGIQALHMDAGDVAALSVRFSGMTEVQQRNA